MWMMSGTEQREENISTNAHYAPDDPLKSLSSTPNANSSRLMQCLNALDQDVQRLSRLPLDPKSKVNLTPLESINNSHVGHYYRLRETSYLSYYSTPSQANQIEAKMKGGWPEAYERVHCVLGEFSEQFWFSVRHSQSHNTLQIQPILNKGMPVSFANVDGIKGLSLDAEFVVILKEFTPIQLSVIKDIEKITDLPVIKYTVDNLKVPCKDETLAEDFLKLVHFKYNQLGLENLDNYLVFKDIGLEQVYRKESSSNVKGFLVKEIPFTSPAQLVEVITLLRKQARFTSLLSTFVIQDGRKTDQNYSLKRIDVHYRLLDFFSFQLFFTHFDKHVKLIFNDDKKKIQCISNLSEKVDTLRLEKILRLTHAIPIVLTYLLKSTKMHSTKKPHELDIKSKEINTIQMENRIIENMAKARLSVDLQKSNDSAGLLAGGQVFRCLVNFKELKTAGIIDQLSTTNQPDFKRHIHQEGEKVNLPRVSSKLDDLLSVSNTDFSSYESLEVNSTDPSMRSAHFSPLIARYFKAFNEPFKEVKKKSSYAEQYNTNQGINNKPSLPSSTSLSQLFASVGGLISQPPMTYPQNQFQPGEPRSSEAIASRMSSGSQNQSSYGFNPHQPPHPQQGMHHSTSASQINDSHSSNNKPGYNHNKEPMKMHDPSGRTQNMKQDPYGSYSNPSSVSNANSNQPGSMLISLLNEDTPKNSAQGNDGYSECSANSNKTRSPLELDPGIQNLPGSNNPDEDSYFINRCYPNHAGQYPSDPTIYHNNNPGQSNLSQQQHQRKSKKVSSPPYNPGGPLSPHQNNHNPKRPQQQQPQQPPQSHPGLMQQGNHNNSTSVGGSLSKSHSTSSVYDFDDNFGPGGPNLPKSNQSGGDDFSISNKVLNQNKVVKEESTAQNSGLKLKIKSMSNSHLAVNSNPTSNSQIDPNKANSMNPTSVPPSSTSSSSMDPLERPRPPQPPSSKTIVSGKPAAEVMRKIQEPSHADPSKSGLGARKNKLSDPSNPPKPKKKPRIVHPSGMTLSEKRIAEGRKPLGRPPGSKNSNSTAKASKAGAGANKMGVDLMGQMNMGNNFMTNPMAVNGPGPQNNPFNNNGQNANNSGGLIGSAMSIFNLSSAGNGYKIPKLKNSSKPEKAGQMNQNPSSEPDSMENNNSIGQMKAQVPMTEGPGSNNPPGPKKSKKGLDDVLGQMRNTPPSASLPPSSQPPPNQNPVQTKVKVETDTPASPTPESPPGFDAINQNNTGQSYVSIPTHRNPVNNNQSSIKNGAEAAGNPGHQKIPPFQQKQAPPNFNYPPFHQAGLYGRQSGD